MKRRRGGEGRNSGSIGESARSGQVEGSGGEAIESRWRKLDTREKWERTHTTNKLITIAKTIFLITTQPFCFPLRLRAGSCGGEW